MDQLKDVLAVMKKYHFWILCGVILIAYLGTWWIATGEMADMTDSRVSKIKADFSTGQSIQGVTNHPNPESIEKMKELNQEEAVQVYKAWQRRFSEQEDVLVWPAELKPDFIAAVEPLIPIELAVDYPTPPEQELKLDFRNRYRDYITAEMPKLAEIIGAEWHATQKIGSGGSYGSGYGGMGGYSGSGMSSYEGEGEGDSEEYDSSDGYGGYGGYGGSGYARGRPGQVEEDPIVVAWSQQNQAALQAASFNWVRPTTLQMLYAQENLWILRALMEVIKSTNGDADAQYNAAIKEIMSIDLGPAAVGIKRAGQVKSASRSSSSGYGEGYGMGYDSGYESGYEGEGEGEGGESSSSGPGYGGYGSGQVVTVDPADYRYVDDQMEPITGDRLRTAMKSTSASDAFLVVAKRMPVRVRFKMNVLKLPLLLCEFNNSDLPVEIRQVRINCPPAGTGGGGYGGGGRPTGVGNPSAAGAGMGGGGASMTLGEEPSGESSGGGYGSGYGSGGGYSSSGTRLRETESPYDATVEIYGLIYIYNPADPAKLGLPTDSEKVAVGTGSPATKVVAPATSGAAGQDGASPATDSNPADTSGTGSTGDTSPTAGGAGTNGPAGNSPAPSGTSDAAAGSGPASSAGAPAAGGATTNTP